MPHRSKLNCPDCGKPMSTYSFRWHSLTCHQQIECRNCGMIVVRSSKSTHDKYVCCGKRFVFLCQVCHDEVQCVNDQDHARACQVMNGGVYPEPPPLESIGAPVRITPLETTNENPSQNVQSISVTAESRRRFNSILSMKDFDLDSINTSREEDGICRLSSYY